MSEPEPESESRAMHPPPHIPTPPSADVPPNVASIPDTFPRWWTGRFIDPVKPAPSWDELDRQAAQEEADQRTGAQLRTMPPGEAAEVPLFLRVGKAPSMGSLPRSLPPPPPTGLWSNAPVCAGSLARPLRTGRPKMRASPIRAGAERVRVLP